MKQRIISAVVLIAILIPLFLLGGIPWGLAIGLVAALGYKETLNLKESHKPYPLSIKILGLLCLELITFNNVIEEVFNGITLASLSLVLLVLLIPTVFDKGNKYTTKEGFYLVGTVVTLGLFFNFLNSICLENKWILLYLILISTMTDTFAMIFGMLIGKHKLIPAVSPKKTVEGSIGGSFVGAVIASIYYYYVIKNGLNIVVIILMSLILSVLGQIGDLFYSKIKRENGIKDFSNIMPGHGGVLDRLDSLSFVSYGYMFVMLLLKIFL